MTQTTEKRSHVRAPIELEIDLESDHNFYSGITCDIGEGGVFVGTHVLPAIGEALEMNLKLPGSTEAFQIRGVVRWTRDLRIASEGVSTGFGMQWIDLPAHAATAIREFVAQRDSIYYEAA